LIQVKSRTANAIAGFRRQLIIRLASVGLIASLAAGIAAFFIETERLDDTLVDHAVLQTANLKLLVVKGLDQKAIDQELRIFLENCAATDRDFFVLVEIYDKNRKAIGEAIAPGYKFVEDSMDRVGHQFPPLGDNWYEKTIISGHPYLQVMVPLSDGAGNLIGWFEGIYRLSPETLHAIHNDIMQITILVMAAVMLTAGVLYPLMSSLHGHALEAARGLLRANIETLKVLGNAIAKRDSDTNAHNYRVTVYAIRIAERLGLSSEAIQSLIKGAFLHDVGKIAVPDAILLKPGKLDEREFAEMKTHVAHGLDIISGNKWLSDAAQVVGGHHEKFAGGGYPQGIVGEDIPLAARIFAIADVFDALTSERPYKKPLSVEATMAILEEGRDKHFDGNILDAFISLMPGLHDEVGKCPDEVVEAIAEQMLGKYFGV
jgi:HD-GYP domain-containing protein (c-di-GMP phosphodiesterase class II)